MSPPVLGCKTIEYNFTSSLQARQTRLRQDLQVQLQVRLLQAHRPQVLATLESDMTRNKKGVGRE